MIVEPTGERTMLPDRGANAALAPADLPVDELRAATHLHLSGYTLLDPGSRAAGLVALEHAREAGLSVSVDPASAAPLAAAGARSSTGSPPPTSCCPTSRRPSSSPAPASLKPRPGRSPAAAATS